MNDTVDPFLVGEPNCHPPYWAGITPGQTRTMEAGEILQVKERPAAGTPSALPVNLERRSERDR
jgi:hypothetical protein